jgi:restriction endonuclease Mrr
MNGGNLSDQQLKEFDAYLNNSNGPSDDIKPAAPAAKPQPAKHSVSNGDVDDLDKIVDLHKKKVKLILDLLDKIDAKAHKDIVADLVDEMQYQKSIVKREEEQAGSLRKLIALADEATK